MASIHSYFKIGARMYEGLQIIMLAFYIFLNGERLSNSAMKKYHRGLIQASLFSFFWLAALPLLLCCCYSQKVSKTETVSNAQY